MTPFVATPLTLAVADLDYAAYMASPDVIRVHSQGRWQVDGFTVEEDRRQILQHQADHEAGRSLAYALLDPARTESFGCVYLNPPRLPDIPPSTWVVTFWIRQDLQDTDLPATVAATVNAWLPPGQLFRLLPAEESSRRAVEGLNLRQVEWGPPYLWYQSRP